MQFLDDDANYKKRWQISSEDKRKKFLKMDSIREIPI